MLLAFMIFNNINCFCSDRFNESFVKYSHICMSPSGLTNYLFYGSKISFNVYGLLSKNIFVECLYESEVTECIFSKYKNSFSDEALSEGLIFKITSFGINTYQRIFFDENINSFLIFGLNFTNKLYGSKFDEFLIEKQKINVGSTDVTISATTSFKDINYKIISLILGFLLDKKINENASFYCLTNISMFNKGHVDTLITSVQDTIFSLNERISNEYIARDVLYIEKYLITKHKIGLKYSINNFFFCGMDVFLISEFMYINSKSFHSRFSKIVIPDNFWTLGLTIYISRLM